MPDIEEKGWQTLQASNEASLPHSNNTMYRRLSPLGVFYFFHILFDIAVKAR
jgi:hypothetical protein